MGIDTQTILRKSQAIGLLELICQALELSETQFKVARTRYQAVGKWLSDGDSRRLQTASIYPQGSIALGTTVRPIGRDEYDLDLVCHLALANGQGPALLKQLIGDRLRANSHYREILEEKPRCWRLNYAREFHLDVTPSIPNPSCSRGGELVPDKQLSTWKPTNPKGYLRWFEGYASLQPQIALEKSELSELKAQVDALPTPSRLRGLLRRCVQLCKRHRDVFFSRSDADRAPISIIITTLAARSYGYCVARAEYETELDLLIDVVRQMPRFIETEFRSDQRQYFVWNETTENENFAEKWNQRPELAQSFYEWNGNAVSAFEKLHLTPGMDEVGKTLTGSFGDVGSRVIRQLTDSISAARQANQLSVVPGGGLATEATRGMQIPPNTFFGTSE